VVLAPRRWTSQKYWHGVEYTRSPIRFSNEMRICPALKRLWQAIGLDWLTLVWLAMVHDPKRVGFENTPDRGRTRGQYGWSIAR